MPTFNRRARLARTLEGLAAQDLDREVFETIVVSDGSTDGTDEYLASTSVPVPTIGISQPNSGPGAARNRGIEKARGELVVFIDDDIVPASGLLSAHLAAHRTDEMLVSIGPMLSPPDAHFSPWIAWEQRMLYKQYDALRNGSMPPTARQFYTGNAAIRRTNLASAGLFDETFRRGEDVELAYRLEDLGLRFQFVGEAIGFHYAERSYPSWRSNAYDYGRNDVIFGRDLGRDWMLELIAVQFESRHRALRMITDPVVSNPRLHRVMDQALLVASDAFGRLGGERVQQAILSVIYNLAYYEGVSDESGDLAAVLDLAP